MNKNFKKILFSMLFAFALLFVYSSTTEAATPVKTLKAGQYATCPSTSWDGIYYKITVPADGYVKITAKHHKEDSETVQLYTSTKKTYVESDLDGYYWNFLVDKSSDSMRYPVKKGTYYIYAEDYDYSDKTPLKVKYTFTKAVNKTNFCRAKAIKLNKNSKVTVVNTIQNTYDRWYKVTLKKAQPITYDFAGSGDITIYDSKGESYSVVSAKNGRYYTYDKLKKGTYYVKIGYDYWNIKDDGASMCTFKWK